MYILGYGVKWAGNMFYSRLSLIDKISLILPSVNLLLTPCVRDPWSVDTEVQ